MSDKPEEKKPVAAAGAAVNVTEGLQNFACQVRDRNDPSKINTVILQAMDLQEMVAKLQLEGYLVISVTNHTEKSASSKSFSMPWMKKKNLENPFGTSIETDAQAKANAISAKTSDKPPDRVPQQFLSHVGTGELVSFAVQLASLLKAGIPLLQSLRVVTKGTPHKYFKTVLQDIIDQVNQGFTFHYALTTHPKVFPSLWCNLIEVGEVSGNLSEVLEEISHYQESAQRMKGKVISAFFYPGVLAFLATGAVVFLLLTIIPKFEEIFTSMDMTLPAITKLVINVSNILRNYTFFVVAGVGLIVFLISMMLKSKRGRLLWDAFILKIPLFGTLILQVSVVRLCRGMGTLLKAGVPILQALKISARLADNSVVKEVLMSSYEQVEAGHSLGSVLESSKVFPVFVTQLINVGEESGELIRFFSLISDYYENKVDTFINRLSTLLEPLMLVFMGAIIGVIVISMFLPLAEISTRGA